MKTWRDVLAAPSIGHHIVQMYSDETFLVEAVSQFAITAFRQGQGVLFIATKSHLNAFYEKLKKQGCDVEERQKSAQLTALVAEDVLPRLMKESMPLADAFNRLAGEAIQKTRGSSESAGIRIFGELVNILWLAGNLKGAMAIEALWDELGKLYPFTLLCGYRMDSLDQRSSPGSFLSVCNAHSHLIPVENYECLDAAVLRGSRDILGDSLALLVRDFAATSPAGSVQMPVGQRTLLWLARNSPVIADKVSARTRGYYQPLSSVEVG